jgi:hypothetical protein
LSLTTYHYAKAHGLSVTEVIDRYLRRLRTLERYKPSPELEAITGLVPPEIDAEAAYRRHLLEKHGIRTRPQPITRWTGC